MPKPHAPPTRKERYAWDGVGIAALTAAKIRGEDVYAAVPDAPREAVDAKMIALGLAEKPRKPVLSDGEKGNVRAHVADLVDRLRKESGDRAGLAIRHAHLLLGEHRERRARDVNGDAP